MDAGNPSEIEIITRICNGEKELYRQIMERYAPLVFHVVRKYETDNTEVTDMAHEIFLKAYEHLGTFQNKSAFSSWLYRLAQHHCLDQVRRKSHRSNLFSELPDDDHSMSNRDANPGPDHGIIADEEASRLKKAMERISETYTTPLLMKYRDGMSYEAISEALEVSVNALKVRVHRARKELKQNLENQL